MLGRFKKYKENKNEGLVVLQKTTFITEELLKEEKWRELSEMYKDPDKDILCAASFTNSLLTHNRFFFALQRDKTLNLIRNDENIPSEFRSIANNQYSYLRKVLQDTYTGLGFIKLYKKGTGLKGSPDIFEVSGDIAKHITPITPYEVQKAELEAFIGKRVDGKPDTVKSWKDVVNSHQKIEARIEDIELSYEYLDIRNLDIALSKQDDVRKRPWEKGQ